MNSVLTKIERCYLEIRIDSSGFHGVNVTIVLGHLHIRSF